MLKLTKKGDKFWLFEDSEIGFFSPSKFTINLLNNVITIVYENGLKSKNYNVIDCEIYDLGATSPFTTSSGDLFMQKLEELNCPCFQRDSSTYNVFADWSELTNFDALPDADLPLLGTEQIAIIQDGETKKLDLNLQVYKSISSNTTIDDSFHGALVWVTATCNITIPSGLRADFYMNVRTFAGATASYLTSGTTINAESDGDVQEPSSMCNVSTYSTNNFIISGGGLS